MCKLQQFYILQEVKVKQKIFMVFDNPEKYLHLKHMQFKDFPIDMPLMKAFGRVISNNSTISVLRLENCMLTSEGLDLLTEYILENRTITDLNLDRNPIPSQNYYTLLENPTLITHLSLRLCNIDDQGAALLAHHLEFSYFPKQMLISLNLSHNRITHLGAQYLGNALRTNRTLLSLSLAGNRLKDEGAILLATPLGKFELTHEEIVERRRRNIDRIRIKEELIRDYMKRTKSSALNVGGKESVTRQGSPVKGRRVSMEGGLQRSSSGKDKKKFGSRESKSSTKVMSKSNTRVPSGTSSMSSHSHATSADTLSIRERERVAIATERRRIELLIEQQMEPDNHPYSSDVWPERLTLICRGNLRLAHLNLAHNGIGSKGLLALYAIMQDQEDTLLSQERLVYGGMRGVLRFTLQGNLIPAAHTETLANLQELVASRPEHSQNMSMLSIGKSHAGTPSSSKTVSRSHPATKQGSSRLA